MSGSVKRKILTVKKVAEEKAEYRVPKTSIKAEPGSDDLWFVWRKGTKPKFRHATEESATKEAQRLSKEHPGTKFCVLHITAAYMEPDLQ